jgi:hypothetical protein
MDKDKHTHIHTHHKHTHKTEKNFASPPLQAPKKKNFFFKTVAQKDKKKIFLKEKST